MKLRVHICRICSNIKYSSVHNDLVHAIDKQRITSLVMLDLSATSAMND